MVAGVRIRIVVRGYAYTYMHIYIYKFMYRHAISGLVSYYVPAVREQTQLQGQLKQQTAENRTLRQQLKDLLYVMFISIYIYIHTHLYIYIYIHIITI